MGEYIKKRKLGSGGFGEVWRCRHIGLNVDHAVKYVAAARVTNPSEFYKEPRLLKELEHPNVVKVFDAGTIGGDFFVAMELLPSGSLADHLSGQPLKLRRLKSIFCEALKGLQYVHDRGYIHRDLKPGNVLVDDRQRGRLADFGLAIPEITALTTAPAGTLTYLAPEVLATGAMSMKTDIYAMGVSLYEAVNGSEYLPAISRSSDLCGSIVAGEFPDRSYYRSYVPRALRTIINKAISADPNKRFGSPDELRCALEQTKIRCSWTENFHAPETTWATQDKQRVLTVKLFPTSAGWGIEVTKRNKATNSVRRILKLCCVFPTEAQARARIRQITQGLVSGKELTDF